MALSWHCLRSLALRGMVHPGELSLAPRYARGGEEFNRKAARSTTRCLAGVQLLAHALDHPVAGTARCAPRHGELPLLVRLRTDLGNRVLRDRPGARSFG